MREIWTKKEERVMVNLKVESKERIWGELEDEKVFKNHNGLYFIGRIFSWVYQ